MRIPQYNSQVSAPNAPRFNNTPNLLNDDLASVVDGLKEVQKVKEREDEEAKKTAFFQADTSIKMEIDKAKHDLLEKIRNGGSYANAEAEYQKAHSAALAKYGSVFDMDKSGNTRKRMFAEYEADGLGNTLQIRDTVTSRRRSDTAASASLRLEQLKRDYAFADTPEKRQEALSKMSGTMASLSSTGIITGAEGKSRLTGVIQGAEADRIALFAQNNAENPKAVLDEVERSKANLSVDAYIGMRGRALAEIETLGTVQKVESYIQDPAANPKPKQQDVDVAFNKYVTDNADMIASNPTQFENDVIDLSIRSGHVPTSVKSQVDTYLNVYKQDMSQDQAAAVAQSARIAASISDHDGTIDSKSKFDATTIAKSNLILTRIDAGMSEYDAVSSVMSMYDDETGKKAYAAARTSILTQMRNGDVTTPLQGQGVKSRYVDIVSENVSIGSSMEEAKKIADKQIKKEYSPFNGVNVNNPADKVPVNGVFYEQKDYIDAGNRKYKEVTGVDVPADIRVVIQGDSETQRMIGAGETPSFPIMLYPNDDRPIPLFGKDGMPVRVTPEPTFNKIDPLKEFKQKYNPFRM